MGEGNSTLSVDNSSDDDCILVASINIVGYIGVPMTNELGGH